MIPLRRALLTGSALLLLGVSASAQTPTVEVTKDVDKAPPGSTVKFRVPILNPSQALTLQAAFRLRLFLALSLQSVLDKVETDHPDIRCLRIGIIGSSEVYDCLCTTPTITLVPGQVITAKAEVKIPEAAPPGSTFTFGATFQWGNNGATGKSILVVIGSNPGPLLSIVNIGSNQTETKSGSVVSFNFEIANIGERDTTGPIDLDITHLLPPGSDPIDRNIPEPWIHVDRSTVRWKHSPILKAGETFRTNDLTYYFNTVRGTTTVNVLAAGGGSPSAQQKKLVYTQERAPNGVVIVPLSEAAGRVR